MRISVIFGDKLWNKIDINRKLFLSSKEDGKWGFHGVISLYIKVNVFYGDFISLQ